MEVPWTRISIWRPPDGNSCGCKPDFWCFPEFLGSVTRFGVNVHLKGFQWRHTKTLSGSKYVQLLHFLWLFPLVTLVGYLAVIVIFQFVSCQQTLMLTFCHHHVSNLKLLFNKGANKVNCIKLGIKNVVTLTRFTPTAKFLVW